MATWLNIRERPQPNTYVVGTLLGTEVDVWDGGPEESFWICPWATCRRWTSWKRREPHDNEGRGLGLSSSRLVCAVESSARRLFSLGDERCPDRRRTVTLRRPQIARAETSPADLRTFRTAASRRCRGAQETLDCNPDERHSAGVQDKTLLIEGLSPSAILQLLDDELDQLILCGKEISFHRGTAEILGRFQINGDVLVLELGHIEGGGEGVLVALAHLGMAIARRRELKSMQWYVHAVSCPNPNPKLRRVLERRGFAIQEVEDIGEVYAMQVAVAESEQGG